MIRRTSYLKSRRFPPVGLKSRPIKKIGPMTEKWKKFRDEKFIRDAGEIGVIQCQDQLVGLRHCGYIGDELDLHHIQGRAAAPELYFAEENLVWLQRFCHDRVHNSRKHTLAKKRQTDSL